MSDQNLPDQNQIMNAKEETMSDQIAPNDTIINDNLFVTRKVGIGTGTNNPNDLRSLLNIGDGSIPGYRPWMERGTLVSGDTDNVFFGLKREGDDRRDAVIAWGDNPIDVFRFIFTEVGGSADGQEIMRLQPNGRVGIGTATPSRKLHAEGEEIYSGGVVGGLSFGNRDTSGFVESPTKGERWTWYSSGGTARLWSGGDKLSVNANGNVGIGTTNPQYARLMIQDAAVPLAFRESDRTLTEGGLWRMPLDAGMLRFDVNTAASGNFSTYITPLMMFPNGNVHVGGILTQGSSRELKENIAELSGKEAVEALENLNPVKFNYKADSEKNLHIGFIAEDVPDLVATSDRKALSPMDIVAVLTQALKEQQKTISALAEKVKLLEAQTA